MTGDTAKLVEQCRREDVPNGCLIQALTDRDFAAGSLKMIWFLGDVHGRFDHVIRLVKNHRPEAVVFLGDLEFSLPLLQTGQSAMNKARTSVFLALI